MKKFDSLDQSLLFNISIFRSMTPTHKKIASAFTVMYRAFMCKNQKESFWGREKIAKRADCSVSEVSRFLGKYKEFIFAEVTQKRIQTMDGKVKYFPNRYKFNHYFFTALWFLKMRGYVKYWHIHGEKLYNQICEDEEVTLKKLGYDFEVVNRQCAHDSRLKTHTRVLGISPRSSEKNVPTQVVVPHAKTTGIRASEIIKIPGMTQAGVKFVDRFSSYYTSREIQNEFEWYTKKNNRVHDADKWIVARLIHHTQYQLGVLTRMKENHTYLKRTK